MNALSPAVVAMDAEPEITSDPMDDIPDPIERARKIRSGVLEGNTSTKTDFLAHIERVHGLCIPFNVRVLGGKVKATLGLLIPVPVENLTSELLEVRGNFNGVFYKFVA